MSSLISEYITRGLAIVPIPSGEKGPTAKGWNNEENAIKDPKKAAAIDGNVGLLHVYCTPSPTAALDIDDFALANSYLSEKGIDLQLLLDADDAVQINSGRKNRGKLLYRLPFDIGAMKTCQVTDPKTKAMILEFRCASANGKTMQDLLPPSIHPDTGNQYQWAGKGDWRFIPDMPDELLEVWEELINPPSKSTAIAYPNCNNPVTGVLSLPPQTVQHLRSALLHMRSDDRELWVKAGMALKALGETGRGLWNEWSMMSKKYEPVDAANTWESFTPTTIDYKFIFAEAQRQGWVNPTKRFDADPTVIPNIPDPIEDSWSAPQKLPGQLRAVDVLEPHFLPEAIRAGCIDIAERLTCPLDYVAIPVLVGAGTVLGNNIGILPKEFDESWIVHTGFWGAIVGLPGSMKTPALMSALKAVHQLEDEAAQEYMQACIHYQVDKARFDKLLRDFKSGKNSAFPVEPTKPTKKRYIVNDVTYQALGEILANNPRGVLAYCDELSGLLQSLDTPGQEAARGFYLSGWGGQGSYTFDRITRDSVHLSRYQLAVFGGFQPDRIKSYVRFAQNGNSKNDGLLQRFQLMAWPDLSGEYQLVDRQPNKAAIAKLLQATLNLKDLAKQPLQGAKVNADGVHLFHFDQEAQELFNRWYQANELLLRQGALDQSEHSHFAKYRSLVPGLALLFHLLNGNQELVSLVSLETALLFTNYLKSHAQRIYASVHGLDSTPTQSLARKLLEQKLPDKFTQRNVLHKGWSGLSTKDMVSLAVNSLVEHNWLQEEISENSGRKSFTYKINPRVSEDYL
jgi:Protein of unknown function (DUF3987)/Bifunctional DNA primase/polymerase, N-terminal/Primase C terminal 2 (PriCT-2)